MADPPPEAARDAHRATENDEEEILADLYGRPGADGVYRGDG